MLDGVKQEIHKNFKVLEQNFKDGLYFLGWS